MVKSELAEDRNNFEPIIDLCDGGGSIIDLCGGGDSQYRVALKGILHHSEQTDFSEALQRDAAMAPRAEIQGSFEIQSSDCWCVRKTQAEGNVVLLSNQ